jgi:hypothetical protein
VTIEERITRIFFIVFVRSHQTEAPKSVRKRALCLRRLNCGFRCPGL